METESEWVKLIHWYERQRYDSSVYGYILVVPNPDNPQQRMELLWRKCADGRIAYGHLRCPCGGEPIGLLNDHCNLCGELIT